MIDFEGNEHGKSRNTKNVFLLSVSVNTSFPLVENIFLSFVTVSQCDFYFPRSCDRTIIASKPQSVIQKQRRLCWIWLVHLVFISSAPSQAPDFLAVKKTIPTNLEVKWMHLTEKYFQGQPIGYNISYFPLNSEIDINFSIVNFTSNTTILTNLTPYTMYVINVSAVSSGGIGPANTVKAQTAAAGTLHSIVKNFLQLYDPLSFKRNSSSWQTEVS